MLQFQAKEMFPKECFFFTPFEMHVGKTRYQKSLLGCQRGNLDVTVFAQWEIDGFVDLQA